MDVEKVAVLAARRVAHFPKQGLEGRDVCVLQRQSELEPGRGVCRVEGVPKLMALHLQCGRAVDKKKAEKKSLHFISYLFVEISTQSVQHFIYLN